MGRICGGGKRCNGIILESGEYNWLERSEFNVSYSEWLVGTKFNWIGLAFKITDNDAWGISVNQLDYGEEEITTPEEPTEQGKVESTGYFTGSNLFKKSYRQILDRRVPEVYQATDLE
jgi:hypothetical protein